MMSIPGVSEQTKLSRAAPYLAGVGFAVIFGLSFLFTKSALEQVDFLRLLGFRFAVAAVAISVLGISGLVPVRLRGKRLQGVLLVALFQPIAYFLFETNGILRSSTSQAGMMIALIPIAVAVLSRIVLGEKSSMGQMACILLSVSGVAIVALQGSGEVGGGGPAGLLFLFGAVCSAAFYNIFSRRSSRDFSPVEITFVMVWMGAIVFNSLAFLTHWFQGSLHTYFEPLRTPAVVTSLLYLGVVSSVLAFFLVNFAISRLPVSQASVFANLVTVVSIAAGVLIRGESFGLVSFVGATMIILGVFGTNYLGQRRKTNRGIAAPDAV